MLSEGRKALEREMNKLREDIVDAYEASGKKVSGEFARGLEITVGKRGSKSVATLEGYAYLAGRASGKMPPIKPILEWVKAKGIFNFSTEQQASGIAWAIAKKIEREGTSKKYEYKIYEDVITPQRIQKIIDNVTSINITEFVEIIQAEMRLLTKNL